jgi:hypothetical protein
MGCRRSLGRRVALGCGGLIGLVIILVVAAYLILQAVGARQVNAAVARIKASGAPTTWEEAIPPPVPDDQNAALLYEKAFAAIILTKPAPPRPKYPAYPYPNPSDRNQARQTLTDYLSAATRAQRKPLENGIRKVLADNAQALSFAREAAKRPKCRFTRNWDAAVAMLMPELSKLRDLSRLASARAVLHADAGDLAGALQSWSLDLSMVNHLESDPTLLGQLDRYSMLQIAAVSLAQILQDRRPSPEQCRRLAQALGGINVGDAFITSFEAERASDLWILDLARRKPQGLESLLPSPKGRLSDLGVAVAGALLGIGYGVISPFDRTAMLRFWEKQIALARRPYRETSGRFDALTDGIPGYALVTRALASPFGRAVGARDKATAELGLMRSGLGLAAYRAQFGAYPKSLNELRASLKWDVPRDPFSGKDFVYRREGAGHLLYSIGPDLKDDGGAPMTTTKKPPIARVGDIVWRMER